MYCLLFYRMAMTNAEKQEAYRERKKRKLGEVYLEKERIRVQGYYVPIEERSKKEQEKRRKKVREDVKKHRERKKRVNEVSENEVTSTSTFEQSAEVSSSTDKVASPQHMVVKFPFLDRKKRTRKRTSRAVSKCKREIKRLGTENKNIERKYKKVSKRYERLLKRSEQSVQYTSPKGNTLTVVADVHTNPCPNIENDSQNAISASSKLQEEISTPRKRTYSELRNEGVTTTKFPKVITDKLILANVLTDEIKMKYKQSNEQEKAIISSVISSKKLKNYRLKKILSLKTGIKRQNLDKKIRNLTEVTKRQRNQRQRNKLRLNIHTFLERDDNSRAMPGKNDKIKTAKGYVQKRVLNDSMAHLHLKFQAETLSKVSFSTFCKMRPKQFALTKYLSRNRCLCQKHQNMALALKAMKNAGADTPINPDEFCRKLSHTSVNTFLSTIKDDEVSYPQWKKVEMPDGKKKTKIVEKKLKRDEFVAAIIQQIGEFQKHVQRVKSQYAAVSTLKENLPQGHVMLQMDFAENFVCNTADEVQSAYWNSTVVTLHPVVAYFKNDNNDLSHKNFVYVSDDLGHNFGMVYAIMKDIMREIKEVVGNLKMVHYWTDSPSSQYRNKSAFYVISNHQNLLGVPAIWNYFETGHGKGPCDGIGGTAKRTADMAIKQGKITVQDAVEFYENVRGLHSSASYRFLPADKVEQVRQEVAEINKSLITVKGTMQVHQVASSDAGKVKTCTTSCYCEECIKGNLHGYSDSLVLKANNETQVSVPAGGHSDNAEIPENENRSLTEVVQDGNGSGTDLVVENNWVAAFYDGDWHIGIVKRIDPDDDELEIHFMRSAKSRTSRKESFKWPSQPDVLDISRADVICKISEPKSVGRSARSFTIEEEYYDKIENLFECEFRHRVR